MGDESGISVSSAGDINGDGIQDIIGAPNADPDEIFNIGQSYVIFGDMSIPIVNNQLTIAAGQTVTLNSSSLFAFTGSYTGEVYFSVSNVQSDYFQLLNNSGIAITQFTQKQLNNDLVQFVSNSNVAPSYSIVANTGIGNAIAPAAQAAQINFVAPAIISTTTDANANTVVITPTMIVTSTSNSATIENSLTPSTPISGSSTMLMISTLLSATSSSWPVASSSSATAPISPSQTIPATTKPVEAIGNGSGGGISSTIIAAAAGGAGSGIVVSLIFITSSSKKTVRSGYREVCINQHGCTYLFCCCQHRYR